MSPREDTLTIKTRNYLIPLNSGLIDQLFYGGDHQGRIQFGQASQVAIGAVTLKTGPALYVSSNQFTLSAKGGVKSEDVEP